MSWQIFCEEFLFSAIISYPMFLLNIFWSRYLFSSSQINSSKLYVFPFYKYVFICESSFFDVRICDVSYSKLQIRLCFISTLHWCFQYCLSQTFLNVGFDVHSWCCMFLYISSSFYWLCTSDIFTTKFTWLESIDYNTIWLYNF